MSGPTRVQGNFLHVFAYRAITVYGPAFQAGSADIGKLCASPHNPGEHAPRFGLIRFRSPLLTESLLLSLPPGTEMFHFPGFARESWLQRLFSSSTRLFAAFYALHSLLAPRHPLHALSSLATLIPASALPIPFLAERFRLFRCQRRQTLPKSPRTAAAAAEALDSYYPKGSLEILRGGFTPTCGNAAGRNNNLVVSPSFAKDQLKPRRWAKTHCSASSARDRRPPPSCGTGLHSQVASTAIPRSTPAR